MLTEITTRRISLYLEKHSFLLPEQKGVTLEVKYPLFNYWYQKKFEDCRKRRKNLNIAWIGYQKAFYSVLYNWIEKPIELRGVNNKTVKFCKLSMEKWSTELQLKTNKRLKQLQSIKINRGIFQG